MEDASKKMRYSLMFQKSSDIDDMEDIMASIQSQVHQIKLQKILDNLLPKQMRGVETVGEVYVILKTCEGHREEVCGVFATKEDVKIWLVNEMRIATEYWDETSSTMTRSWFETNDYAIERHEVNSYTKPLGSNQ